MLPEEEKPIEPTIDDEDGFTDEIVLTEPEPAEPVEEPKPEEPAPAEEEPPPAEEEEPEPEIPEETFSSDYDDPRLQAVEDARGVWNKSYKKMARIKFIVSTVILLGILAGWLIPTLTMKDQGLTPLLIGIGCAVAGIAGLLIFGYFQRKHDKVAIAEYFKAYFDAVNAYVFDGLDINGLTGEADDKITREEFIEGGAFDAAAAVGSRDSIVFSYRGMDCAMAEAAAQIDAGKSLQTIFVGKYLRTKNTCEVSDEGLIIYFSGNDRALPPKKLESLHVCENNKRFKVYGSAADKKVLTKKVREALGKIRTDKLLVDITICIKPGRTYWYLGYEDDLMVLPNDKPFDPQFVKKYKTQLALILDAALELN